MPQVTDFFLTQPLPVHFEEIQALCKRVYPFSKPWAISQLESHRSYFPDGQLIVIENATGRVVGMAFSLIIPWDDYSPKDNWTEFTASGFFHNHNPKKGKTLYGAEVMVDPSYQGKGIGKLLYQGRKNILEKYKLKRIRAGARLRGYSKYQAKLTPIEYVHKVVAEEIFDPTLSFQLRNGFKVIDVVSNYLTNDPESGGYAAVIEWLSPKFATQKDLEKQEEAVISLLIDGKSFKEALPKELRKLVRKATTILGDCITECEGKEVFGRIYYYKEQAKTLRKEEHKKKDHLEKILKSLQKENSHVLLKVTHAFSLQMELINVCEAAYRTWRLRQSAKHTSLYRKTDLTYVLTAHPTEARTPEVLRLLSEMLGLYIEGLQKNFVFDEKALQTKTRLLFQQSLSKERKPSVQDEAEYINGLVFDRNAFDYLQGDTPGFQLLLRTWVGGDKDGHPGVNSTEMLACLEKSRDRITSYLEKMLSMILLDVHQLIDEKHLRFLEDFKKKLSTLKKIRNGDGSKVKAWTLGLSTFVRKSHPAIKAHYQMSKILNVIQNYPALVLPIELREHSKLIEESLKDPASVIRDMLSTLHNVKGALSINAYAKAFIISNCERSEDLTHACVLVYKTLKSKDLKVVPLFESKEALEKSEVILKKWFAKKSNLEMAKRHWGNSFEIMLGYSDSAKQVGVLSSRFLIAKTMQGLEKFFKSLNVQPIFFHGSGGSVARGGGSLKEQLSWWSGSAIASPKMTIQGEMIQRQFATREILESQCSSFTNELLRRKVNRKVFKATPELSKFEKLVQGEYSKLIQDPDVLGRLLNATPYNFLEVMKFGSRPSKRPSGEVSIKSLRAIPWVLCWTQSRSLLPSWWGTGTAWQNLSSSEQQKLKVLLQDGPFFSSYIKILAFSLAKVELDTWSFYFDSADDQRLLEKIKKEFSLSLQFVRDLSGQENLLWYRPWLAESIRLRSADIDLLNMVQTLAMKRSDERLLRETIVGIACGMLTTG